MSVPHTLFSPARPKSSDNQPLPRPTTPSAVSAASANSDATLSPVPEEPIPGFTPLAPSAPAGGMLSLPSSPFDSPDGQSTTPQVPNTLANESITSPRVSGHNDRHPLPSESTGTNAQFTSQSTRLTADNIGTNSTAPEFQNVQNIELYDDDMLDDPVPNDAPVGLDSDDEASERVARISSRGSAPLDSIPSDLEDFGACSDDSDREMPPLDVVDLEDKYVKEWSSGDEDDDRTHGDLIQQQDSSREVSQRSDASGHVQGTLQSCH